MKKRVFSHDVILSTLAYPRCRNRILGKGSLGLLPEHHDGILFGKTLSADIINVSHTVLSLQFPEVSGLQRTFFNACPSFYRVILMNTIGSLALR